MMAMATALLDGNCCTHLFLGPPSAAVPLSGLSDLLQRSATLQTSVQHQHVGQWSSWAESACSSSDDHTPVQVPAWGEDMQQRQAPLLLDVVQPHVPAWRRRASWLSSSTSARSFSPPPLPHNSWGSDGCRHAVPVSHPVSCFLLCWSRCMPLAGDRAGPRGSALT